MITKIGIVAGEIWHYLDTHGKVMLSKLHTSLERDETLVLMSVGWLAREGHVVLEKDSRDYAVSLRGEE